jgi:hypothetical protein
MSNRRKIPTVSALQQMTGHRIPGGCADCDAYQVLSRQPDDTWGAVYVLTVHHDETCPWLAQRQEATS